MSSFSLNTTYLTYSINIDRFQINEYNQRKQILPEFYTYIIKYNMYKIHTYELYYLYLNHLLAYTEHIIYYISTYNNY